MAILLESGQVLIEMRYGLDAAEIIFEKEMFVRGVSVFIGQTEADEHAGNLESVRHLSDEGDGAAFADEHRFFLEAFLQSGLGFLKNRRVVGSGPGLAGAEHFKFAMDGLRQEFANVFFDEFGDALGVLSGNQAGREFCVSLGRDDSLGAFALIAAPDTVEFKSGANPELFDGGKPFFPAVAWRADGVLEGLAVPGQAVKRFAFGFGNFFHVVVEARNGDPKLLVVQLGEKFGEDSERVRNSTAVHAGVEISFGSGEFDLIVVEAAQAVGD